MSTSKKIAVAEPSVIIRSGLLSVLGRLTTLNIQILEIAEIAQLGSALCRQKPDMLIVNPALLDYAKEDCAIYDSAKMTLEEVIAVMAPAARAGKTVVRLHTGDSSIYGAVREQFDELEKLQISYDVCPGVSAFCGAAAALKAEYTLPDVSQTVIITRAAGKTPVPEKESIRSLAAHQATMVLFLSTSLTEQLQKDLLAGGYAETTPAAVVYKATWRDQKIFRCTVGTLHKTVTQNGLTKTSLIVVGGCLGGEYMRSLLYHPGFSTEFREASE